MPNSISQRPRAEHQTRRRERQTRPLDANQLRDLALAYVGKYATSEAKLTRYLARKLAERGWAGEEAADIPALVGRLAELRYVDDQSFAIQRAGGLLRRGYGARRIEQVLSIDGISEPHRANARELTRASAWNAAHDFARRKRIGPYALAKADPALREKQIAAFLRAGHEFSTARRIVDADPGEDLENADG